jgi:hypothetical protein
VILPAALEAMNMSNAELRRKGAQCIKVANARRRTTSL